MSPRDPLPDAAVEPLVRAYLDGQARRLQTRPLLERIRAEAAGVARRPGVALVQARRGLLGFAAAAAVLVAFLGGVAVGPREAQANPELLLRRTLDNHAQEIDRCYRVVIRPDPAGPPRPLTPPGGREHLLWTRGDRFTLEPVNPERGPAWKMGRDHDGRLWMALTEHQGVVFEKREVKDAPEPLRQLRDVLSLPVDDLLTQVLRNCDTRRVETCGDGAQRIAAELKPGREAYTPLRTVTLEIHPEARVVRELVVTRQAGERGLLEVTATLLRQEPRGDEAYTLKGHLKHPRVILSRTEPTVRQKLLLRHFGLPVPPERRE